MVEVSESLNDLLASNLSFVCSLNCLGDGNLSLINGLDNVLERAAEFSRHVGNIDHLSSSSHLGGAFGDHKVRVLEGEGLETVGIDLDNEVLVLFLVIVGNPLQFLGGLLEECLSWAGLLGDLRLSLEFVSGGGLVPRSSKLTEIS